MLKAIFAMHLVNGDGILLSGGQRVTVADIEFFMGIVRFKHNGEHFTLKEYDLVGLGHRPRPEGKTEQDTLDLVMHCVRSLERLPFGRSGVTPLKETLNREIKVLGELIEEHELGKSPEPEAQLSKDGSCRMGRCKHPKNWAGTCLHWAMRNQIQCDERR